MLYELQDIPNIVSLKIVGREKALQILLRDVQFVKGVREYMAVSENFLEFAHFNIAYHSKIIHRECGNQNCEVYKMQLAKIP